MAAMLPGAAAGALGALGITGSSALARTLSPVAQPLFIGSAVLISVLGIIVLSLSDRWTGWMPAGVRDLYPSRDIIFSMALASVALALKMLLYGGFNGLREMRMQMILELTYLAALTVFIVIQRQTLGVALLFRAIGVFNALVFIAGLPAFFLLAWRLIPEGRVSKDDGIVLELVEQSTS